MAVLVVGGSGFIGQSLCHVLLDRGHVVTVASWTPDVAELPAAVDAVAGDVTVPGT